MSIFIDKPWSMVDSDSDIQKLIFKRNHELVMSKNGQVSIGRWQYLSEAKCLMIDRGIDKILLNEGFLDKSVMILKKDGTDNTFYVLANQNELPDLDVEGYLKKLRHKRLYILTLKLKAGGVLEVLGANNHEASPKKGHKVTIDASDVPDGGYELLDVNQKYYVKDGVIAFIVHVNEYKTKTNQTIVIEQFDQLEIKKKDLVFIDGSPAPDGNYNLRNAPKIIVKNGAIVKMPWWF